MTQGCEQEGSEDVVRFQQWQPNGSTACPPGAIGSCYGKDPGLTTDYGLIDIAAQCMGACPNGSYNPGHVSWSVAYLN